MVLYHRKQPFPRDSGTLRYTFKGNSFFTVGIWPWKRPLRTYLRKWFLLAGVPSLLANVIKDDAKQVEKTGTEGKMDLYSYHQKTGNFIHCKYRCHPCCNYPWGKNKLLPKTENIRKYFLSLKRIGIITYVTLAFCNAVTFAQICSTMPNDDYFIPDLCNLMLENNRQFCLYDLYLRKCTNKHSNPEGIP